MWAEYARGYKGGLDIIADTIGISDSKGPMNIKPELWGKLLPNNKQQSLDSADDNIEAATILLKRINERIKDTGNPAHIGSIWNVTGQENTNEFGEYIGLVYKNRPWLEKGNSDV